MTSPCLLLWRCVCVVLICTGQRIKFTCIILWVCGVYVYLTMTSPRLLLLWCCVELICTGQRVRFTCIILWVCGVYVYLTMTSPRLLLLWCCEELICTGQRGRFICRGARGARGLSWLTPAVPVEGRQPSDRPTDPRWTSPHFQIAHLIAGLRYRRQICTCLSLSVIHPDSHSSYTSTTHKTWTKESSNQISPIDPLRPLPLGGQASIIESSTAAPALDSASQRTSVHYRIIN